MTCWHIAKLSQDNFNHTQHHYDCAVGLGAVKVSTNTVDLLASTQLHQPWLFELHNKRKLLTSMGDLAPAAIPPGTPPAKGALLNPPPL